MSSSTPASTSAKRQTKPTNKRGYIAANPTSIGARKNTVLGSSSSGPLVSSPSLPELSVPSTPSEPSSPLFAPSAPLSRVNSAQSLAIPNQGTPLSVSSNLESDLAVTTVTTDQPQDRATNDYRLTLEDRAKFNCAAEHPAFKKKQALCYAFLEVRNLEVDDMGKLVSCRLHCFRCPDVSWGVNKRGGGTTKNFNDHFSYRHARVWEHAKKVEADATGAAPPATLPNIASMLSTSTVSYFYILQGQLADLQYYRHSIWTSSGSSLAPGLFSQINHSQK